MREKCKKLHASLTKVYKLCIEGFYSLQNICNQISPIAVYCRLFMEQK